MNHEDVGASMIKRVKLEASEEHPSLQYRIQIVDESLLDEAMTFMGKYFSNNNLGNSLVADLKDKKLENFEGTIWKEILSEGISLAAILEDDQGNRGRIICCYALGIVKEGDKFDLNSPERDIPKGSRCIIQTLEDVTSKADVFKAFDCDEYIDGCGLATATDFQRRGIAGELMRACPEVCKLTGTPVCAAVFTAEASQKLAFRCGYKTLAELDLTTYRIDDRIIYPNPECPVIKFMAIRYF
nr:PREDICTED: uncharacterized protein LOC109036441 [Bemisia tabaci]